MSSPTNLQFNSHTQMLTFKYNLKFLTFYLIQLRVLYYNIYWFGI